jgi:DMSO/TMAO reductase YedYZ molybdopterin-dependent catalytic subunit
MKRVFFIILSAAVLLLAGCSSGNESTLTPDIMSDAPSPDAVSSATMDRYRENEIKEYKGARLDPAVGPRDNSINGVQQVDIDGYTLTIDGLVDHDQVLTYDDVLAMEADARLITLHCVEGWVATILWEGVRLSELIDLAGAQPEAVTVVFSAADGYTTSLPYDAIKDNQLILAYNANGIALPPEMGYPFIVVAEDKQGYKWARWVNRITLSDDAEYQGYWEQRGYSNSADIE